MNTPATAEATARRAKEAKPHVRYAYNKAGTAVAAWDGRWVLVAGLLLTGQWCSLPWEVLVNGKPTHAQEDWIEVHQEPPL